MKTKLPKTIKSNGGEVEIFIYKNDNNKIVVKVLGNGEFYNWEGERIECQHYVREEHFGSLKAAENWGKKQLIIP
jgi:hypothetical protein